MNEIILHYAMPGIRDTSVINEVELISIFLCFVFLIENSIGTEPDLRWNVGGLFSGTKLDKGWHRSLLSGSWKVDGYNVTVWFNQLLQTSLSFILTVGNRHMKSTKWVIITIPDCKKLSIIIILEN